MALNLGKSCIGGNQEGDESQKGLGRTEPSLTQQAAILANKAQILRHTLTYLVEGFKDDVERQESKSIPVSAMILPLSSKIGLFPSGWTSFSSGGASLLDWRW